MRRLFAVSVIALAGLALAACSADTPTNGVVVGKHHDKTGYWLRYSADGELNYVKVNDASYITCAIGKWWNGSGEFCTLSR